MKRVHLHILAGASIAILCLPLLATEAQAFELNFESRRGKFDPCAPSTLKGANEHKVKCPATANTKSKAVAPGSANKTTSGATSGSSEHASVRGTINGGGDFIAPQIKTPVHKPRSVAPKARQ